MKNGKKRNKIVLSGDNRRKRNGRKCNGRNRVKIIGRAIKIMKMAMRLTPHATLPTLQSCESKDSSIR